MQQNNSNVRFAAVCTFCIFSADEKACYVFSIRNNCCEYLEFADVNLQSFYQPFLKKRLRSASCCKIKECPMSARFLPIKNTKECNNVAIYFASFHRMKCLYNKNNYQENWQWSTTNLWFQEWLNNTLNNSTIRCKKLATIVSGRKYVARPFVRRKQANMSAEI